MTDVFISYSTRCPVYADMIEEDLEHDGYSSWRDRSKLRGGEKWKQEIQNAIQQSTIIIVLVTKPATQSKWIQFELGFASSLNKPCIPLIMEVLKDNGVALQHLGVGEDQAINFVTDGRRVAYAKLLDRIKRYTDEWLPIAVNIERLNHFSSRIRLKAVDDLADTRDMRVIPILVEMLGVEDQPQLGKHIFKRLSEFNHPLVIFSAMTHLEEFTKTPWMEGHQEIIQIASKILETWGPSNPGVDNMLLHWIDTNPEKSNYAARILQHFDEAARERTVDRLLAKLDVGGTHPSLGAALGLAVMRDPRSINPLRQFLEIPHLGSSVIESIQGAILKMSGSDLIS